jgi:hypothetical protein
MVESNNESSPAAPSTDQQTGNAVQVNIRLRPGDRSGQPIFSNFTVARGAPGTVLVDFGFVEPNVLNSVIRRAQSGEKVSEGIEGQVTCRVALNLDTAAQLAQQLNQLLQAARKVQTTEPQPAAEQTTTSPSE